MSKRRSGSARDRRIYKCFEPCSKEGCNGGTFRTNAELERLRGCTSINGDIIIIEFVGNPDFSIFDSLTSVSGNLIFYDMNITEISGFNALVSVGQIFGFGYSLINSMSGFSSLKTVGGFIIGPTAGLTTIPEFNALTTVSNFVAIQNNFDLLNISGFSALTTIGGYFSINNGNTSLLNISGFLALTPLSSTGNVSVTNNNIGTTTICQNTLDAITNAFTGTQDFTGTTPVVCP